MANKTTKVLTKAEYDKIMKLIETGFELNGVQIKPNIRIYIILFIEANTGMRIGDIMKLKPKNFYKTEDEDIRIHIIEEKTEKVRDFPINEDVFAIIYRYIEENKIQGNQKIFEITTRQVQKHLALVSEKLGLVGISTHSFRKFFSNNFYNMNGNDLMLTSNALLHSAIDSTLTYVEIDKKSVENALKTYNIIPEEKIIEINTSINNMKKDLKKRNSKLIELEETWFINQHREWSLRYLGFTFNVKCLGELANNAVHIIEMIHSLGNILLPGIYTSEEAAKLGVLKYINENFL